MKRRLNPAVHTAGAAANQPLFVRFSDEKRLPDTQYRIRAVLPLASDAMRTACYGCHVGQYHPAAWQQMQGDFRNLPVSA